MCATHEEEIRTCPDRSHEITFVIKTPRFREALAWCKGAGVKLFVACLRTPSIDESAVDQLSRVPTIVLLPIQLSRPHV